MKLRRAALCDLFKGSGTPLGSVRLWSPNASHLPSRKTSPPRSFRPECGFALRIRRGRMPKFGSGWIWNTTSNRHGSFAWIRGETTLRRPPVLRVEYLFLVRHHDGSEAMIGDPANPRRVATALGDHSVLEFPGYEVPPWLAAAAGPGETVGFAVRAAGLRRTIAVTMWSPPGTTREDPLPMLALHDGPELAQLAAITRFSAAMIALGRLPAHRLALLSPGHRDSWYSASLAYAHALHRSVLPAVRNVVGVGPAPVLAGMSLGALAALHATTTFPGTWAALFLQSGSFFRRESDEHESRFAGFGAITRNVQALDDAPPPTQRLYIGMTVGLAEENLTNNRVISSF